MRVLCFALLLFAFMPPAFVPSVMAAEEGGRKILYWVAPMNPDYRQDKPGKSPMGMDLIPVYENEDRNDADAPEHAVRVDSVYRQALGVKTGTVAFHEFGRSVHAFGHIAPSTRLVCDVDVRTTGWIVDLAVDAVGDTVKKGDLLFTYYSPDLMEAQSDFLIGNHIGNAEQRLRLYGMSDAAIAALRKAGKFLEKTPFYAPCDGTVATLDVRKGAHVGESGRILTLQDYSKVWVEAHLPLRDMQFVSKGTPAKVLVGGTGDAFQTAVDFIYPATDPQSRDGMVRLILDNPDGRLKTDALVNVTLEANRERRLAVPEEAVLYGGRGTYVIRDLGEGYFKPVMVTTGITEHGLTEITGGLAGGENIVTSGQFMIDAESNLQGGLKNMDREDMRNVQ